MKQDELSTDIPEERYSPSTIRVLPQLARLKAIVKHLEDLIRKNDAAGEKGGEWRRRTSVNKHRENDKETKYSRTPEIETADLSQSHADLN